MSKHLGLAVAIFVVASVPAWAQSNSCGDEPIPPAIPSAAEIGQKSPADALAAKHQAFEDIKAWQTSLKNYRDCLNSTVDTATRERQDTMSSGKSDPDKMGKLQAQIDDANHAYNHSTDSEERVVNDFHALSTAFCARSDVDRSSCPKS